MKKNKSIYSIIIGTISLILIGIIVLNCMKEENRSAKGVRFDIQIKATQYLGAVTETIMLCEKENIKIDEGVKRKFKEYSRYLLENINEEGLRLLTLSNLMRLNKYYNLGKDKELLQVLEQYYVKEKKIFSNRKYEEFEGKDEKDYINSFIYNTVLSMDTLKLYSETKKYKIDEGVLNWYQENIKIVEDMDTDIDENEEYKNNLINIFWGLSKNNGLEKIEMKEIFLLIKGYFEEEKEILLKKKYKKNIINSVLAKEMSDIFVIFEENQKYVSLSSEIFQQLNSDKSFEYEKEDEHFFIYFVDNIKIIGEIDKNTYLKENINKWIAENFKTTMEKVLDNMLLGIYEEENIDENSTY